MTVRRVGTGMRLRLRLRLRSQLRLIGFGSRIVAIVLPCQTVSVYA